MSLIVNNLTKKYGDFVAVNSISFELKKGEITGFLGQNGAGKSTTMKMITGSLVPFEGDIKVMGFDLKTDLLKAQSLIGYLPEHNPLYLEMFVREYLEFCASFYQNKNQNLKEEVEKVIEKTSLTANAHKKISELSKGYRQRVGLAAALIHNPDILILDEPTTGLDPNQILEIRQIIKELGKEKTILFSSHIMQEIEALCDRVIIINKGEIVLDSPMDFLQNKNQTIEVLFDYRLELEHFKNLPHLKEVVNNYDFFYTISFDTKEDMRTKIFDFATENGVKILQINHKHEGLEEVFKKYTN